MKISTLIIIITVISLALFYIITWTGSDDDLTPYIRGDYATAVKQFREAAEQGDAAAQYNLALMYGSGKGVPQDDTEAMKWYSKSAEQGYAYAQYNLSMVYFFGQGVPQDYVAAYKWLILAADQGENHAKEAMPMLVKKMTPEQISEAQAAAQAWSEKNRQPVL
jgi:TPR repeat protein